MRALSCPSCATAMRPHMAGSVEVDLCDGCGTAFLDPGELAQLTDREDHVDDALTAEAFAADASPRLCAQCGQTPRHLQAGELGADVCLGCGGVLLDSASWARASALALEPAPTRASLPADLGGAGIEVGVAVVDGLVTSPSVADADVLVEAAGAGAGVLGEALELGGAVIGGLFGVIGELLSP